MSYEYIERTIGPNVCEFYVRIPQQGHRIVRIYLDGHSPRFVAFNETSDSRSPATLFKKEIDDLIFRAREILDVPEPM